MIPGFTMSVMRCYIISTIIFLARGEVILPFADGTISSLTIDGNALKFTIDSGDGFTYVVYKGWYEKKYGKGACANLPSGCYTCPTKCNPYKKEKYAVAFANGMMFEYALQRGTLTLNGQSMGPIEFGLIIGYTPSRSNPNELPFNVMGLAYGSQQTHYPILRQLYINGVIDKLAFHISSPSPPDLFTGTLVLGASQGAYSTRQTATKIPLRGPSESTKLDSSLSIFGLVSSRGAAFSQEVVGMTVMYDTGAYPIVLPKSVFEAVLNKVTDFASKDSGQDIHVKTSGVIWYIEQKGFIYFPTLTFSVGAPGRPPYIIRIPPRQYATMCDGTWCILMLYPTAPQNTIILGRPFFTTFATGFDLIANTLEVSEYTSTDTMTMR